MRNALLDRTILRLAVPAIIANITTPLLSLVDIAIVGHLGSAAFVGAIAVGGSLFNMIYWLFSFLRFGTSGITAQAVGAGNNIERQLTLLRALFIAATIGGILIAIHRPLGTLVLDFMDPEAETRAPALVYFNLLIYGAPAVLMQYSLTGWFVGMQDTRTPMWNSLLINLINISASVVFVYVLEMGIEGVALGTLTAQWVGCMLLFVASKPRLSGCNALFRLESFKRFFVVNVNIFLRTLCLIAVTMWFTRAGAAQGSVILAANTLLLQLFVLFSYFMDGFAFAAEALCGKCVGAGNRRQLRLTIARLLRWGFGVASVFTLVYITGGEAFLSLLTDNGEVIAASGHYRLWAVAVPFAGFMAFTWDGIVIGMTRTRLMLESMALSSAVFFAVYFALSGLIGNHALWLAFVLYLLLRGVLLGLLSRRQLR